MPRQRVFSRLIDWTDHREKNIAGTLDLASIVFDLDGTLVDSAELLSDVGNAVLEELHLPLMDVDEARSYIGNGAQVFLEKSLRARKADLGDGFVDALSRFLKFYEEAPGDANKPFRWVNATLKALVQEGHSLALCTNKPMAPTQVLLRSLGWEGHFRGVVCGDTLAHRKPHPAPLLEAVRRLPSSQTFYVGDSEVDAETAHSAQIPFILFTEGYASKPIDQLSQIASFDDYRELSKLIANLSISSASFCKS